MTTDHDESFMRMRAFLNYFTILSLLLLVAISKRNKGSTKIEEVDDKTKKIL